MERLGHHDPDTRAFTMTAELQKEIHKYQAMWEEAMNYTLEQEIKKALDNGDKIMTELKTAVEKCVELNKQITNLEAELDEARRLQRWGDSEVEEINRLLDLMGAPATMDNGLPYNIAGRLSALAVKNATLLGGALGMQKAQAALKEASHD